MNTRKSCETVLGKRATLRHRGGFTLIELLTVIAIIGILAAILIPVVGTVRDRARSAACQSNLRQIGIGIHLYAGDNNQRTPVFLRENNPNSTTTVYVHMGLGGNLVAPPVGWGSNYVDTTEIFFCPSQPNVFPGDGPANPHWSSRWGSPAMGYIWFWRTIDDPVQNTSRLREDNQNNVIAMDMGYQAWINAYDFVQLPHGESLNTLRLGGHVVSTPLRIVNGNEHGTGTSAIHRRMNEYHGN